MVVTNRIISGCWVKFIRILVLSSFLTGVCLGNVTGPTSQTFNPTHNSRDFITVAGSRTLDPGQFHLGLFLSGQSNTLPYFKDDMVSVVQSRSKSNDILTVADVGFGYGILQGWDLGISLPQILSQSVKSDDPHGQYARQGLSSVRLSSKVRLMSNQRSGLAFLLSGNLNQTETDPYSRQLKHSTVNAEVVGDYRWGRSAAALNIGIRHHMLKDQNEAIPAGAPEANQQLPVFKGQSLLSLGYSYLVASQTQMVAELFSSQGRIEGENDSDRSLDSAESLFGLKYFGTNQLVYQGGIGTELAHGISTADWRLYAGIQWSPNFAAKPSESATAAVRIPRRQSPQKPTNLQPEVVIVVSDVLFALNSDRLVRSGAKANLDALVQAIKRPPAMQKLVIEGHTCSLGTVDYNAVLSLNRAAAVRSWLIEEHQINPTQIEIRGFGEMRPLASNAHESGRKLNRRVEFKIYRHSAAIAGTK